MIVYWTTHETTEDFGSSLATSDVTLVWDDGKQVKANKDKLCRESAGSGLSLET